MPPPLSPKQPRLLHITLPFPFSYLSPNSPLLLPLFSSSSPFIKQYPTTFSTLASFINHQTPWPSSPTSPPVAAIGIKLHLENQNSSSTVPQTPGRRREANFVAITPTCPYHLLPRSPNPSTTPDSKLITSTLTLLPGIIIPSVRNNVGFLHKLHGTYKQIRSSTSSLVNISTSIFNLDPFLLHLPHPLVV